MTSKKIFFVMVGSVAIAAAALVGFVMFGNQLLQKQSGKLTDLKVQNAVVDSQQAALTKARKDLVTYSGLNDIAKQIVPQDKDQARAVREIVNIAAESGVGISGITFPASTLGQAPPKAAPKTDSESSSESETAAPAKPVTPPVSQVKPVEGISGVFQLDLTVSTDTTTPITYAQLITFLSKLEQNRRTAQITNLSITPNPSDRNLLTIALQLTIYIKP